MLIEHIFDFILLFWMKQLLFRLCCPFSQLFFVTSCSGFAFIVCFASYKQTIYINKTEKVRKKYTGITVLYVYIVYTSLQQFGSTYFFHLCWWDRQPVFVVRNHQYFWYVVIKHLISIIFPHRNLRRFCFEDIQVWKTHWMNKMLWYLLITN